MKRCLLAFGLLWLAVLASAPAQAHDTVYYYYTNTLHSAVVETDAQGNIVEPTTYYAPYGQVLNRSLRDGPGYTGHEEDPATRLNYMQQRYYDPQSGRFVSTDPVLPTDDGGNFNRYAYADDNPYRYTDPDGECSSPGSGTKPDANEENVTPCPPPPPKQKPITLPTIIVTPPAPVPHSGNARLAQVDPIVDPEDFLRFALPKVGEIPKPNFEYPTDPTKPPAPGFKWEGRGPPGSRTGNWYEPKTRQSLHPDLKHAKPIGPHWDWKAPDGKWYRWYPDGRIEPKFNPDFASL